MHVEKASLWPVLQRPEKQGPLFAKPFCYQPAVFMPTLSCEEAPLYKVDVQKFSKQFHQEASQDAPQGIDIYMS
jgi:hypothetical protein